jgi:hypothetical protein
MPFCSISWLLIEAGYVTLGKMHQELDHTSMSFPFDIFLYLTTLLLPILSKIMEHCQIGKSSPKKTWQQEQ